MVKRSRVHSRDIQPQIATPKGLFAAARVQRLDFPMTINTTDIDELGRTLHVGTTSDIPEVTVTFEAFDVSHNTYSFLTGYTPATFPVSGVSITELKNVDVLGQIKTATGSSIVNAIYVKRGIVTGLDASFGVRDNSTVSYTVSANSKKELRQPVFYDSGTLASASGALTLSHTPTYLTRTSGYVLNAYRTGTDGTTNFMDEGTDFTVTGTTVTFTGAGTSTGDIVWVTYSSSATGTFQGLDNAAAAAVQGKYVPLTISVSNIQRVQSATIKASFQSEQILEMGGLGKPVGYEIGVPSVTGDISVLKTDNDLLALLEGVATTTVEQDMEYALTSLPLKIQLKDPRRPSVVLLTYYVPSITITAEGDQSSVNASINETFSWKSTTGDLFIASGVGPW
jgi:hypothetical protein